MMKLSRGEKMGTATLVNMNSDYGYLDTERVDVCPVGWAQITEPNICSPL